MVEHIFNPNTLGGVRQATEARRSFSTRPALFTQKVPGQSGLYRKF